MSNPRMTVTFRDPAMEYISAEAKRLGISKADVVRRIIDEKRLPWAIHAED